MSFVWGNLQLTTRSGILLLLKTLSEPLDLILASIVMGMCYCLFDTPSISFLSWIDTPYPFVPSLWHSLSLVVCVNRRKFPVLALMCMLFNFSVTKCLFMRKLRTCVLLHCHLFGHMFINFSVQSICIRIALFIQYPLPSFQTNILMRLVIVLMFVKLRYFLILFSGKVWQILSDFFAWYMMKFVDITPHVFFNAQM